MEVTNRYMMKRMKEKIKQGVVSIVVDSVVVLNLG